MPWDFMGRNGNVPHRRKPANRPFRNGGRTSAMGRGRQPEVVADEIEATRNRRAPVTDLPQSFPLARPTGAVRLPLAASFVPRRAATIPVIHGQSRVREPHAARSAAPRDHPIPAFSQPARPEVGLAASGAYRLGRPHFGSGPRPGEKGMRCGPEAKPAAAPATVSGERPRTRPLPHTRREGPGRMPGPASQETCRGDHPVRARGAPGTTDLSVAVAPRPVRARARA